MPGINILSTILFRGPLLRGSVEDITDEGIRNSVRELVVVGERDVKLQLRPGHGLITGHYRRSIHGEIINSRNGIINDSRVVYGPWLEGTSSRNQTTRFKGYAMFRQARDRLNKRIPELIEKHINKMASDLGGK